MPLTVAPADLLAGPAAHARGAAARAAARAHVHVTDVVDVPGLHDVAAVLAAVWGTSLEAAPVPADLLRSIGHAGGNVTAVHAEDGSLCGAAVAIISTGGSSVYSLIAGLVPAAVHAGVGFALKQHQRAWALAHGFHTMTWTFDPLVGRNGRFNLTKLGARASEYIEDFYGAMDDQINLGDESDRLVVSWALASDDAVACGAGRVETVELPDRSRREVVADGPDGRALLVDGGGSLWCRAPSDIVALRRHAPAEARAWRAAVRSALTDAFARGFIADGVTATGWYRLTPGRPAGLTAGGEQK